MDEYLRTRGDSDAKLADTEEETLEPGSFLMEQAFPDQPPPELANSDGPRRWARRFAEKDQSRIQKPPIFAPESATPARTRVGGP